jgi:hypothetical protein
MALKLLKTEVSYFIENNPKYAYKHPQIIFTLQYCSMDIVWDLGCITECRIATWMSIRESMDTGTGSKTCGAGSNSRWYCYCESNKFSIEFVINEFGGNSNITISLPADQMKQCIDKIIDVCNYATKNERHPDSICE